MNQEFIIQSIGLFALYNFFVILIASVIYFFSKEFYRVRNNNPSTAGRVIVGSLMGIFIMILLIFINYEFHFEPNAEIIPRDWGFDIVDDIYPTILLNPSFLFMIIFPVMLDRKLVFPIFVFMLMGYFVKFPWESISNPEKVADTTSFAFALVTLLITTIAIYFLEQNNLFKNNGIKTLFMIGIYMIIIISLRLIQTSFTFDPKHNITVMINNSFKLWGIELFYTTLIVISQMSIIYIIERAYANFNKLETFTTKDDISFYKMSLAQNKLKYKIDDEKINMGLLILVDVPTDDTNLSSNALSNIRDEINSMDQYKNSFFFKATNIYYGIFIPIEEVDYKLIKNNNKLVLRSEEDSLYSIDQVINEVSEKYDINIKCGVSIYGLHSYDVAELIEYSRFLLTPVVRRSNKNSLIVYDFDRVKIRLSERNKVMDMPIDINSLSISYLRGVSEENIYYPNISYKVDGKINKLSDLSNSKYSNNIIENILRYTSYQSIRKFKNKNSSLIIYYPVSKLSSAEFSLEDFEKKVSRYMDTSNIIIGLFMNKEKSKPILRKNIELFKKKGYRFAILHDEKMSQEKHDLVMPEFIIDIKIESNPLKIEERKIDYKTEAIRLNTNLVL